MRYNLPVIRKWVKALESGRYKQTTSQLCHRHNGKNSYCCLGVLARVQGKKFDQAAGLKVGGEYFYIALPSELRAGLSTEQQSSFIRMNDELIYSFKQIAAEVRRHILKQKPKAKKK